MKTIKFLSLLALLLCFLGSCSSDDSSNKDMPNPNTGIDNYSDIAVTGAAKETGMTYVDVVGYVNYPEGEIYDLPVGIEYGEKPDELTTRAYGENKGRNIYTTIQYLKPNTTYYYRTFVGPSEYYFVGKQICSFKTKELSYNGKMTANLTDQTFQEATLNYDIDTQGLNKKEDFRTAIVYSEKPIALNGPQLLEKFNNSYYDDNSDLHFISGSNSTRVYCNPEATVYYCPFITIGQNIFVGEKQSSSLRKLPDYTNDFIDLGLSCEWGTKNLGASNPMEEGDETSSNRSTAKIQELYGSDCNLPTKEQVEELAQCKMEIIDYGLLITGPNGKQIYLPRLHKVTNYGTASTESVGFGSGAYSYWDYYEIEYNFYQKPAELYTERSAIPYYSSILPNRYNYSTWAVRAIKNK